MILNGLTIKELMRKNILIKDGNLENVHSSSYDLTSSQYILKNQGIELKDGYIVVVFKTIKTETMGESDYLSYAKPNEKTRFEKEGAEYMPYTITLPNGVIAEIPLGEEGIAMAIYEAGIRANDDYETEGTH